MGKHSKPESGPLGGRLSGPHHPNGWDSRRDAKPVSKPDSSGNRAGGGPVGDRSRDPDRG